MTSPFGPAARLADAYQRKGARVVLRRLSQTPGPTPLINPPRVAGATLRGPLAQGGTAVALAATSAVGRLMPGDALLVAGVRLEVTAIAAAGPVMTPGFVAVAIAPAPVAVAAGTPVLFSFGADTPLYAMINSYPLRLVDGQRIMARDLQVSVPAYNLPDEIPPTWSIVVNGREMTIVTASPVFQQGEIMSWTIQARL